MLQSKYVKLPNTEQWDVCGIMRLTITKKLIGAFLIIAVLFGITSSISTYYLNKINKSDTDLIQRRLTILTNVLRAQKDVTKEFSRLRGYMLTKDSESLDGLNTSFDNVNSLIKETSGLARIQGFQEELQKLGQLNQVFKQEYDQLLTMVDDNRPFSEILDYYQKEVIPVGSQLEPIAEKLANEQIQSMKEASDTNTNIVNMAVKNVTVLSIVAFVLAILIGYFISRVISKPIVLMAGAAERIAGGDLTAEDIRVKNKDEVGSLAKSFNEMTGSLRTLVGQISMSSEHIAASSEELTASAAQSSQASESITLTLQDVTANAELQSSSVGESVQAINEMSSGIQQIASSAQITSSLSMLTSQKALEGNEFIQTTVKQMDSIHSTMDQLANAVNEMDSNSNEIERIVVMISEIAAQTNLLALNAGIEAARAGEQGRGFAVVAGEVRRLAEQSSQSAEQISQLVATIKHHTHHVVESVEDGVIEVDEGIRVVHTAGELFDEIKKNVDEVSNQIQDVSASSQQISASSEQVLHAIEEIAVGSNSVVIQSQNVAAATEEQLASMEEISSSSAFLAKMAEDLQNAVKQFKI
ncbi:methyl-accepting chemotaxis protein [Paenibacillus chibensis]|uniref:Methyl-accepting chemotaxis protein n=1 Tax=Paenibacillus chibensis TaxID=59846 RepID=A0ABU6PVC4_9BACL|nr:methyl-accepting chemotaxis protein [Paenibacillus chibensis]